MAGLWSMEKHNQYIWKEVTNFYAQELEFLEIDINAVWMYRQIEYVS